MRIVDRREKETKCSLEFLDDSFGQNAELDIWMLVVQVFCKLGNAFCVGFCLEFEAFCF